LKPWGIVQELRWQRAGKNLKPYQGLKLHRPRKARASARTRRKKPKTLSGIETKIT